MSQENVATCRRALDAVNRRDRPSFLALCDPEIEDVPPQSWPESGMTRGPEAVWKLYVDNTDVWEQVAFQYVELFPAGDDRTVGEVRGEVRGKESGAAVTWSFWQVVTFRHGKTRRIAWFGERGEALAAAGVRE
jgi:ketosteroid isomerase-like protein